MVYFDTFAKIVKNARDLGKLIVAKGFKKLPKVQKIAQSGHTVGKVQFETTQILSLSWIFAILKHIRTRFELKSTASTLTTRPLARSKIKEI